MTKKNHISATNYSLVLVLCISTFSAFSQSISDKLNGLGINTVTTSVPFLVISPDSRAGSMGDVGAATSPDANSMHWNPSKYAFAEQKMGFSVCYTPWFKALVPDISLSYLAGYYKPNKNQAVAATMRYFSLGAIQFTDGSGGNLNKFTPNEFAFDVAFAQKLSKRLSGSMAVRYIYSNLTGGTTSSGVATKAGQSVAADLSAYYQNSDIKLGDKKSTWAMGINVSNIGQKISYSSTSGKKDFIPINLKLGTSLNLKLDDYNQIAFSVDANKLLVPTQPVYAIDTANAYTNEIIAGKDPDRSVVSGMFGSFTDAPGGGKEELHEITYSAGMEYWYDKQFALRGGYFYEHPTKGNRKYFTLGFGLRYNVFGLDFSYLIPSKQRTPLENTLRFSLLFDFGALKGAQDQNEISID